MSSTNGKNGLNGSGPFQLLYFVMVLGSTALILAGGFQEAFSESDHLGPEDETIPSLVEEEPIPPIVVKELVCFTCHSWGEYVDGGRGEFTHLNHQEDGPIPCHSCHGFDGHNQPVMNRLDECDDCH